MSHPPPHFTAPLPRPFANDPLFRLPAPRRVGQPKTHHLFLLAVVSTRPLTPDAEASPSPTVHGSKWDRPRALGGGGGGVGALGFNDRLAWRTTVNTAVTHDLVPGTNTCVFPTRSGGRSQERSIGSASPAAFVGLAKKTRGSRPSSLGGSRVTKGPRRGPHAKDRARLAERIGALLAPCSR